MSGFNFLCTALAMLILAPFAAMGIGSVIILIAALIQQVLQ